MTVSLRGTRDEGDNYQVFRLIGQLDAFSEPVFKKILNKHIDDGPANIILDLSQIDFLDSSGQGALVQLAKKVQGLSGSFQIVTNQRVTQSLRLVRLDQFLTLRNTLEEAVEQVPGS
ncbi:STAS domain-containing protein [Gloeobacter kilaueensis]|uniref:Anti-sigma factor antagonist n=1 Tax=Gloeobacter kilaueensis (strain ATCC BAA-2537 / CCAP 1431/1 / ULC 316 / JS1) TaxID=1183438 RepID=U5QFJ4_GLOK1|nr:STAS domain-containing protein [Gloeobacter kilaueensis]AGY57711.1 anti-sigma-factor antagonist [Gloeobacter kilaueensis JS1]